ncbi:hypothetical protein LX36DRAFT_658274 [Colletotrichum falcatum]|nr:hypothetical protein LX36DRAFT_658274 [Colletotrichum falcatum]
MLAGYYWQISRPGLLCYEVIANESREFPAYAAFRRRDDSFSCMQSFSMTCGQSVILSNRRGYSFASLGESWHCFPQHDVVTAEVTDIQTTRRQDPWRRRRQPNSGKSQSTHSFMTWHSTSMATLNDGTSRTEVLVRFVKVSPKDRCPSSRCLGRVPDSTQQPLADLQQLTNQRVFGASSRGAGAVSRLRMIKVGCEVVV